MTNEQLQSIRTFSYKSTLFFIILCVPLGLAHIWLNLNIGQSGPDSLIPPMNIAIFKLFLSSFGLMGASGLSLIATTIASWLRKD